MENNKGYESDNQNKYPQSNNPQQNYPQQGYPQQGNPQQGYPPPGYPPQGNMQQGYPPQGYPPQGNMQSQNNTVIVTTGAPVFTPYPQAPNFSGAIALSCFVYWCCGGLFGLIAFILAMIGSSNNDLHLRKASYGVSIAGIVVGIIIIIALAVSMTRYSAYTNTYTRKCTYNSVTVSCDCFSGSYYRPGCY